VNIGLQNNMQHSRRGFLAEHISTFSEGNIYCSIMRAESQQQMGWKKNKKHWNVNTGLWGVLSGTAR